MSGIQTNKKQLNSLLLTFLALAWPTVLEQLLSTILQYVDTAMVGHLGTRATTTVSLSTTYTWLIGGAIYGLGIGFLSYISRAVGAMDETKIHNAAGQAVLMTIISGILLTVAVLIIAPLMPVWMGAEEDVRHDASLYFIIISLPLIFRASATILGSAIRATGNTKTPMIINVTLSLSNVVFNALFIYVLDMGAIGAGIATAISYSIGGILMFIAFIKNATLKFTWKNVKPNKMVLKPCLIIAFPVIITQIISSLGYIVATSFVSAMTTTIYAAHSIAITAEQLFYIPGYGMQTATSTLIGNSVGEQNPTKTNQIIRISMICVVILMLITGTALFFGAPLIMQIFTNDAEVIEIGSTLLRIVAFTEPVFGGSAVMTGIYAGLGNTKPPLFIELFSRWGIRILGSYITIKLLHMGINEIWYCMIADNITKAILLAIGLVILIRKIKR